MPSKSKTVLKKQNLSLSVEVIAKARAKADASHGGNLSRYVSHLIEEDTGTAFPGLSLESLAGEVQSLRGSVDEIGEAVRKLSRRG